MRRESSLSNVCIMCAAVLAAVIPVRGDDKFDKLMESGNYDRAVEYAEEKIPASDRDVNFWIKLGFAYQNAREIKNSRPKALECLKNAQKVNPSDPEVYLGYGRYEFSGNEFEKAQEYFMKSYLLKRTAKAAEGIAMASAKLKQWDKAQDAAESAVSLDSSVHESRLILAELYLKDKGYANAAIQLEHVVKKEARKVEYWKDLAMCYEKTNNREGLAEVDPQIIKLDGKNVKSRQRHAEYSLGNKDTTTAFNLYKELAILAPGDAATFKELYSISNVRGEKKDATLYLRNYLVIDSTNAEYQRALADLLYEQKDLDGAIEAYRKTLKLNAKAKGLYRNYLDALLQKKLEKDAADAMPGAIAAGEADGRLYEAVGDIHRGRKEYRKAVDMYQGVLQSDPKNMKVLTALAECQAKSGDDKDAILAYEQVVLVNPNASKEFSDLGDLYQKSGNTDAAMKTYKKYLVKSPTDQKVAAKVGMYEYANKQYREAIKYLNVVQDPKLQDVDYLVSLGDCYFQSKEYNKAAELFEKVRARKPGPKTLAQVLKPLGECYESAGKDLDAAKIYNEYTLLPGISDAELSYRRAYLREKSDRENAAKMYEANTKSFPADYRNFMRLGLILADDNAASAKAADMLGAASRLVDTVDIVWEKLGDVSGKLNRTNTELAAYQKLLKLQPQHLQANKRVGQILLEKQQTSQAISNLEMVLTASPKDVGTMLLVADGYMATKRPEPAATHLAAAKEIKPEDVKIRLDLIKALEAAGKKDAVAQERVGLAELDKKIVARDKKDVKSRRRLLEYSLSKDDNETVHALSGELAVLTPKDPKVLRYRYESALALGKKKEASGHIKEYLATTPKDAKAQVTLGNLLYEQKDLDGAATAYRSALKTDPSAKGFYARYVDIVLTKKLEDEAIAVIKGAIAAGEADVRAYTALGDIYKSRKQYVGAVQMYQAALKEDAKNVAVLTSMAECQASAGDIKNATLSYEQVVMMNPQASKEFKALGNLHMRAKKVKPAMEAYKKYLVKVPGDNGVARTIGLHEHGNKDYAAAIKYLSMVSDPKLQDVLFHLSLGEAHYATGDCQKASAGFAKAWESKPATAVLQGILKPLGDCYEKLGRADDAAKAYAAYTAIPGVRDADVAFKNGYMREKTDKVSAVKIYEGNTRIYPKDYRNFLRLGMIYAQDKGKLAEASERLRLATTLSDTIAEAWERYAQVSGRLNKSSTELAAYQKFLTFKPMDLEANRRVGAILLEKKQTSQAITNLEMVLTSKPDDVETMLLLADAYEATKRLTKSMELLDKAKKLKKDDVKVRMHLYSLYQKEGKKDKAMAEMKELVDLTKDNKYRAMYAGDLVAAGKLEDAAQVARDIKAADPMNADGLMLMGDIQRAQGKNGEAIETYKAVLFMKDNFAPALYGRGEAYLGQNDLDRAQEFFDKAVKARKDYALGYLGQAKVAKARKKTSVYQQLLAKAKALDPRHPAIVAESK